MESSCIDTAVFNKVIYSVVLIPLDVGLPMKLSPPGELGVRLVRLPTNPPYVGSNFEDYLAARLPQSRNSFTAYLKDLIQQRADCVGVRVNRQRMSLMIVMPI